MGRGHTYLTIVVCTKLDTLTSKMDAIATSCCRSCPDHKPLHLRCHLRLAIRTDFAETLSRLTHNVRFASFLKSPSTHQYTCDGSVGAFIVSPKYPSRLLFKPQTNAVCECVKRIPLFVRFTLTELRVRIFTNFALALWFISK